MKKQRPRLRNPSSLTSLSLGLLLTLMACGPSNPPSSTDTTPPGVPSGLKASAGHQLVSLKWNANTEPDLKGYILMYGLSAQNLGQALAVEKSRITQTVTQLSNGTAYSFALKAEDTSGNVSALSSIVSAIPQASTNPPDTTPPAVPSGLRAEPGDKVIEASWAANPEADLQEYVLAFSGGAIAPGEPQVIRIPKTQTNYRLAGLTNGITYTLTLAARDQSGNVSGTTTPATAIPRAGTNPPDTTPPAIPKGLRAVAGDAQIRLSWMASSESDLKQYVVKYGTSADALNQSMIVDAGEVQAGQMTTTITGLTNGTVYFVAVQSQDSTGNTSALSSTISAKPQAGSTNPPDTTPPAVPQSVTVQPSSQPKELHVTWNANTEADLKEYQVTYREGAHAQAVTVDKALREVVLKDLKDLTEYSVTVAAIDTSGNRSAASDPVKATTRDPYQAPFVKTYWPLTTAVGVLTDAEVSVEFSRDMNRQSVEQALKLTANDQAVTPSITWLSNRALKFKPAAGYAYGAEVQWQIDSTARSADGAAPNGTFEAHFRVVRIKTEVIPFFAPMTGWIAYDPTPLLGGYVAEQAGFSFVGDTASTLGYERVWRGFASFEISALPNDVIRIASAQLEFQRVFVRGNPFKVLGKLNLHRVKINNSMKGSDFNATQQNCVFPTTGESFVCYRSVDQLTKSFDVTDMVASDWAERNVRGKNSSFRLRFASNTGDAGHEDRAIMEAPSLKVSYEYP